MVYNSSNAEWNASISLHGSRPNHFCLRYPNSKHTKFKRTFVYEMNLEGFAKAIKDMQEYDSLCKTPMHKGKLDKNFVQRMVDRKT